MKKRAGMLVLVAVAAAAWVATRRPEPTLTRRPVSTPTAVYDRYGCAMCHGADGKGGLANPNAETEGKVPSILFVAEGYTPAELRRKILEGASVGKADPKGPRPPYRMPGWGGVMSPQEADALVQYLVSLYPKRAEEKW